MSKLLNLYSKHPLFLSGKDSGFQAIIKKLISFAALIIPLLVGYFHYVDSYQFPKWKVFLSGVIMGAPFSFGLFLSNSQVGKRFKVFTSLLILLSATVRSLLLLPPQLSIFIFLIEIYAIYCLFVRREAQ